MTKRGIPILVCLLGLLSAPGATNAEKKIIYPPKMKQHRPNMPFSPGVQVGNILWVAGQTGGLVAGSHVNLAIAPGAARMLSD